MTSTPAPDPIHAQHVRLITWLCRNGRTSCAALGVSCDVPSVTKRVCELIAEGWPIQHTRGHLPTRSGGRRLAAFHELTGPPPRGDLFETPTP